MKKQISDLLAVLVSLFYLLVSWTGSMAVNDAVSQGRTIYLKFLNLPPKFIISLIVASSLSALIGTIAGSRKVKPWTKQLSVGGLVGGLVGISLLQLYQYAIVTVIVVYLIVFLQYSASQNQKK